MYAKDNLLLEVKGLRVHSFPEEGAGSQVFKAVDGIDLAFHRGRALCLVGENRCGKSTICRIVANLVRQPGQVISGKLLFHPDVSSPNLLDLTKSVSKQKQNQSPGRIIPGLTIAVIAQDPVPSISEQHTVGSQVIKSIQLNHKINKQEARQRALDILAEAGIQRPDRLMNEYPIHLSADTRLRLVIVLALCSDPSLLIIDDPVTMLDVPNRSQILDQIAAMQQDLGMSVLYATRDLALAARLADDVAVMHRGRIVEIADVSALFSEPEHPYTQALLKKRIGLSQGKTGSGVPSSIACPPSGCEYHPFCPRAVPACAQGEPRLVTIAERHDVRCFLHETLPVEPLEPFEQNESDGDVWQLERFLMR